MTTRFDVTIEEQWRDEAVSAARVRTYRELRSRQVWLTTLLDEAERCLLDEKQPNTRLAAIVTALSNAESIPPPVEGAANLVDHLFAIQEKTMDRLRAIYEEKHGINLSDVKAEPEDRLPWVP